jgi:hypothetical protein
MITRTRRARPTTPSPADYLGDTPHQAILPRPCLPRTLAKAYNEARMCEYYERSQEFRSSSAGGA